MLGGRSSNGNENISQIDQKTDDSTPSSEKDLDDEIPF